MTRRVKPLTPAQLEQLAELRARGRSTQQIARELGVGLVFLQKLILARVRSGALPKLRERRLWSAEEEARLIDLYHGDMTTAEIARELGRERLAVNHKLHRLAQAGRIAQRCPRLAPEIDQEVAALRAQGLSIVKIAGKVGIGTTSVTKRVAKLRLPLPERGSAAHV
jgi:transposase-like protein